MRLTKSIVMVALGLIGAVLLIGGANVVLGVHTRPDAVGYGAVLLGVEILVALFIWAGRERLRAVRVIVAVPILWPLAVGAIAWALVGQLAPGMPLLFLLIVLAVFLPLAGYSLFMRSKKMNKQGAGGPP